MEGFVSPSLYNTYERVREQHSEVRNSDSQLQTMASSANTTRSMKVVDQFQVSPPLTPSGTSQRPPLPLSFFDILWIFQSPVNRVFLFDYPYPTTHFIQSHLPNLKSSLSLTLASFYPLAGKLQPCPDSEDRFELRYEDGDSVTLTLAECGANLSDLKGSHARDFSALSSLVPKLGQPEVGGPLIAIQVTIFPSQGIAIGISVHHVACDGHSSVSFVKSWAAACSSAQPLPPPSYDRTATADPFGAYKRIFEAVQALKPDPSAASPGQLPDLVIATSTLTSDDIRGLKELVEASSEGTRVSTFVVSCAYAWVCLAKLGAYMRDRCSHFVFMVDWRGRMEPQVEVERSYFGNCVWPCFVEVKVEDLIGKHGVVAASEAIGAAIQEDLTEGLAASIERASRRGSMPRQPISVSGTPRFGVYDIDFGWGRAEKVEVVSIRDTGTISLSESREERGGVQIGLLLPRKEMEEFTAHFVGGLRLRS